MPNVALLKVQNSIISTTAQPLGPGVFGGGRWGSRLPLQMAASPSTGGRTARTGSCVRMALGPPVAGAHSRRSMEVEAPQKLMMKGPVSYNPDP